MKHSVTVKFIAVLLCTLSLVGAVLSAGSIAVLTEMNLYNKTVDQVMEEEVRMEAENIAHGLVMRYAGETLGGCPEEMLAHLSSYVRGTSDLLGEYGYVILDDQGSILQARSPELKEAGTVYTIPAGGQYAYLISETPMSEKYPQEEPTIAAMENDYEGPLAGRFGLFDAIPEDGSMVDVYSITMGYADDSGEGCGSISPIGVVYHDAGSRAVFIAAEPLGIRTEDVTYICFKDEKGSVLYEARGETAVGTFYLLDGAMIFEGGEPQSINSANSTEVHHVQFYSSAETDRVIFELKDTAPIGIMEYAEDGRLTVVLHNLQGKVAAEGALSFPVSRVSVFDGQGRILMDHAGSGSVTISQDKNELNYSSADPLVSAAAVAASRETGMETIPVETMPAETHPETLPPEALTEEASAETIPEEASEEGAEAAEEETRTEETVPETTVPETTVPETTAPPPTEPEVTEEPKTREKEPEEAPLLINGKPLSEYGLNHMVYYSSRHQEEVYAEYVYVPLPAMTVELYSEGNPLAQQPIYMLLGLIRNLRSDLFLYLGISLLVFAITVVFLCVSAGHQDKSGQIHAGGLNRMPLDAYLFLGGGLIAALFFAGVEGTEYILHKNLASACAFALAAIFLSCLTLVGFGFAAVAQIKTPGGYLWKNTLFVRLFSLWLRLLKWLEKWMVEKLFPWLFRTVKKLWALGMKLVLTVYRFAEKLILVLYRFAAVVLKTVWGFLTGTLRRFLALLPLTWQWMLGGFLIVFVCMFAGNNSRTIWGILWGLTISMAVVLYVSHCFGVLMESAKRMSKGDLDSKVEDKLMMGCFQEFAGDLNALADVAVVAAQKQLKSERMKTELITNVSHDIKTPLTSIINYVDLLQKPHTEEEGEMYLEVLQRQSQRLKKLIEDLMDMSKASTGNMSVELTQLDAVECVNQALGEFGDKLERAQLIPVFRHGEEGAMMTGDGRLVWRVLSNLLGNAVKYAMPGTRLYIDLMKLEGKVVISLKNISRDELNVDAEELMERFVRGDDSRNTEGSGLGLNIAKSLMELQKGQLQLLVDGDLFKVTLIFPGA